MGRRGERGWAALAVGGTCVGKFPCYILNNLDISLRSYHLNHPKLLLQHNSVDPKSKSINSTRGQTIPTKPTIIYLIITNHKLPESAKAQMICCLGLNLREHLVPSIQKGHLRTVFSKTTEERLSRNRSCCYNERKR